MSAVHSPRVLLMDTSTPILKLFDTILIANGYRVTKAKYGQMDLEKILVDPPDLLLLCLTLDGDEAQTLLRALMLDPRAAAIHILICESGLLPNELVAQRPSDLALPASYDEILAAVRKSLQ